MVPIWKRRVREARDEEPFWGTAQPPIYKRTSDARCGGRSRAAGGSGWGAHSGPGLGVKTGVKCGGHPGPSSARGAAFWGAGRLPEGPERGGRQLGVGGGGPG